MAREKKSSVYYSDIFTKEMPAFYRKNPVRFVYDIIFQRNPEYFLSDQQKQFLNVFVSQRKRISVKSGKGVGKTSSVSFLIIWFLCCFDNPKIVCSAPTAATLYSALWSEIALWLNRSAVKDIFDHTATKLYLKEEPKTWYCEPRTAKDPISMQGLHQENMLIIVDEASGLRQDIFESLDTTLTMKNNKLCLIGNPNLVTGPFAETFGKFSGRWVNLSLSALDSPFVTRDQIEYYEQKYGKNHDLYKVNVLGEFPSGSPEAFLKLSDINAAIARYDLVEASGEFEIGLDVARYGDDSTVLYYRRGLKVFPPKVLDQNSVPEAAQLVLSTVEEIRSKFNYNNKIRVKVDETGLGAGVVDLLVLDREHNIEVIGCNNGGKGDERFHNEISCMWGLFRDYLCNIGLPEDSTLVEELSSRNWKLSNVGKTVIEPKTDFKKRYGSSPDRSDALMLCFYNKQSEKTIIKNFDPLDSHLIKDRVEYLGEDRYGSLFYGRDVSSSLVYATWNGTRLYVYDEHVSMDAVINVISNILGHGKLNRLVGNDRMFNVKGDDLSSKFRRYGVNIYENFAFNEISAIETLNNMITQRKIIFSRNCTKMIEQLSSWKMENSRYDMEDKYGLCYALLYLISELKYKIDNKVQTYYDPIVIANSYGYTQPSSNKNDHWMLF